MNLPKLLVPVSVASGPPVEVVLSEAVRRGALTGKRRAAQDRACKEQNKNRYCRPIQSYQISGRWAGHQL